MKRILTSLYANISLFVFGIISIYLCTISLAYTCYISIDWNEHTFYLSDKPIRNLLIILLLIISIFIIKKNNLLSKINNNKKIFTILKYLILLIIFLVGTFWILSTRLFPAADQYSIQKCVSEFLNNNYSSAYYNGYLNNNSQQRGFFMLSYLFALIFKDMNIIALEITNVLAAVFIFKSLSEIVGIYKGSYCMQLFILLCGLLFPVVILYSYFIYGNFIGLAFALLAFKNELLFFKTNKITNLLLSSIFILLAMLCKSTYQIYFIAMIICLVFNVINNFNTKKIIFLSLLFFMFAMSSFIPNKFIESKANIKLDKGLSFYSYTAMGLQESDKAPGWYNGFNHDSYASCNNNYDLHKEYAKKEVMKRLDYFLNDLNYADAFFTKKIVSQWNNPTYQVFWNIQDKYSEGFKPELFIRKFLSLKNTYKIQKYLNIVDFMMKFGCVLFLLYLISNINNEILLLPITFIGGFLFLSFLSEAKAQYTIMFSILMLPLATLGYNHFVDMIINKNYIIERKGIIKIIIFCIVTILTIINVKDKTYLIKDDDLYYKYVSEEGNFDYLNPPEYF